MTINEAIKHAEEVAAENQRVIDTGIVFGDVTIDMFYCDDTEVIEEHLANYQRCAEEHRQLAEWLKELKRLREQMRWIPVSERLPEENGVYIVSYEDSVRLLEWFNDKWFFYSSNPAREETGTIIAWQSLPQPYKTESEGKE